jgi:hypothetical protein
MVGEVGGRTLSASELKFMKRTSDCIQVINEMKTFMKLKLLPISRFILYNLISVFILYMHLNKNDRRQCSVSSWF